MKGAMNLRMDDGGVCLIDYNSKLGSNRRTTEFYNQNFLSHLDLSKGEMQHFVAKKNVYFLPRQSSSLQVVCSVSEIKLLSAKHSTPSFTASAIFSLRWNA